MCKCEGCRIGFAIDLGVGSLEGGGSLEKPAAIAVVAAGKQRHGPLGGKMRNRKRAKCRKYSKSRLDPLVIGRPAFPCSLMPQPQYIVADTASGYSKTIPFAISPLRSFRESPLPSRQNNGSVRHARGLCRARDDRRSCTAPASGSASGRWSSPCHPPRRSPAAAGSASRSAWKRPPASRPNNAVSAVIITGRTRLAAPSMMALLQAAPLGASALKHEIISSPSMIATPKSEMKPTAAEMLKLVSGQVQGPDPADRQGEHIADALPRRQATSGTPNTRARRSVPARAARSTVRRASAPCISSNSPHQTARYGRLEQVLRSSPGHRPLRRPGHGRER